MNRLHEDLGVALAAVLADAIDQPEEFKRRLRRLIENSVRGNLTDEDVRGVIELADVDEEVED